MPNLCENILRLNPFILVKHHYLAFHIRLYFFPETHIHNIFTLILDLLPSYLIKRSNCFGSDQLICLVYESPELHHYHNAEISSY